jgi:hypothetical protein
VVELQEGEYTNVVIDNPQKEIFIEDTSSILELDIHGQKISSIEFLNNCPISKLVAYDNELTSLDLSNCNQLQFLHIHNNPMCDNDDYMESLVQCMDSLTDRFMAATGSIILYPWYGLEVLVCKNGVDSYVKYPNGVDELELQPGTLYGVVENNEITYYTYEPWNMIEHTSMNRHHTVRKQLEQNICLRKNWVFGSAIMYSDDWDNCTWDFRQNNIADMWETAEKGFGLTIGIADSFTNTLPGFKYLNLKDMRRFGTWDDTVDTLPKALDYTSEGDWAPYLSNPNNPYTQYKNGKRTHGDSILSIVFGTQWCENSVQRRFGYIPNACAVLNDNMTVTGSAAAQLDAFDTTMKYLANNSDALSFSFGLRDTHERVDLAKTVLGKFGENNILVVSSGNSGDGLQYTSDPSVLNVSHGSYANYAGSYTDVDTQGNTITKPTSTIFVGSCGPLCDVSSFSNNSVDADLLMSDRNTYLSAFGDQLFVWNNHIKSLKCGAGTSYSAPLCCSVLLLLKNIYIKMFPDEISFGKYSNFMDHVRNRWCIHKDSNMDSAEGYGVPHIFASPYAPKLLNNVVSTNWEPVIKYSNEVSIGEDIELEYETNNIRAKSGCTVEPLLSYIAIDSDNAVYPLKPDVDIQIKIFSNSSLENPINYRENYHTHEISINSTDADVGEVDGSVNLCESVLTTDYCNETVIRCSEDVPNCEEFTVQFALDFSDKLYPLDIGQYTLSRELFYFYNGNELGRFYINGISYISGDKYVTLSPNTMLHHRYFSATETRGRNLVETQSVGYGINNKVDFNATSYAIITVTVSDSMVTYYFNGTNIGSIIKLEDDDLQLSKMYINKQSLCHNGMGCVRMYDRVLSEKEIIQNTVSMLNSHFDGVV